MILPGKHLTIDRSLMGIGAELLELTKHGTTVSTLWEEFSQKRKERPSLPLIGFNWFILTLDFLFMIGALKHEKGVLRRRFP